MKFTLVALAAFAGIANAQSQCAPLAQSIPPCALGYIASYAYSSASCGLVDFGCQCSNLNKIAGGVGGAIQSQSGCQLAAVLGPAQSLCSCVSSNSAAGSVTLNSIQSKCQATAANIPACALGYLAEGAFSVASCSLQDFECQCSNFDKIESAIINTVQQACGDTAIDVISSANALCACATGGSGGSGGSGAATTTGGSSPTGGSSSAAPTGGSSGSGTASKTMSVFTGAGSTPAAAFGGLFGIVAGLAAFL